MRHKDSIKERIKYCNEFNSIWKIVMDKNGIIKVKKNDNNLINITGNKNLWKENFKNDWSLLISKLLKVMDMEADLKEAINYEAVVIIYKPEHKVFVPSYGVTFAVGPYARVWDKTGGNFTQALTEWLTASKEIKEWIKYCTSDDNDFIPDDINENGDLNPYDENWGEKND